MSTSSIQSSVCGQDLGRLSFLFTALSSRWSSTLFISTIVDLRAIQTANLVLSMPLLFDLVIDWFAFFRVVITMDWVLHYRTSNMAHHINNLLLVVIHCFSTTSLAFLHRMMVRGRGDLRCQHLLSHWMMLHWLHLEIRWRYCKVA